MESPESTRNPSGIHVETSNNLAGLPAKKFNVESMWNMWKPWIPGGFHLESMGECKVLQESVSCSYAGLVESRPF